MSAKSKRKSLSKKNRFEVFKRDEFRCQYCGATPPKVILEIDHIDPIANGGSNDIENLITACFDCNRGKSKRLLSSTSVSLPEHYEKLSEKEEQIKGHKKLLANIKRRKTREENKIGAVFSGRFEGQKLTSQFKKGSVRKFLDILPFGDVEDAMFNACNRIGNPSGAAKYFCGICWSMVKENE